jgi:hypothetical protein
MRLFFWLDLKGERKAATGRQLAQGRRDSKDGEPSLRGGNAFKGENKRPGYLGRRYQPSLYARGEQADLFIAGPVNRANGDLCRHRHYHCASDDVRNRRDQRRFPRNPTDHVLRACTS